MRPEEQPDPDRTRTLPEGAPPGVCADVLDGRVLSTRRASDPESLSPGVEGETLVYVLSDDNFNAGQRTLLMMFALEE